jgi:hypothetical protein
VVDSDEDEKDNNSEVTEYMSKEHIYDKEDEDELEVGTELTEDIYDD